MLGLEKRQISGGDFVVERNEELLDLSGCWMNFGSDFSSNKAGIDKDEFARVEFKDLVS